MDAMTLIRTSDYALINAAQVDPSRWSDLTPIPVVPEIYQAQPQLFPVLVDIRALDLEMQSTMVNRAAEWEANGNSFYFLALLKAPVAMPYVVDHLVRRMAVRHKDGRRDVLRFYDPFVFRHLRWLLSSTQMDSLLGPAEGWYWREPDGSWRSQARCASEASPIPVRLTPEQWPTLTRMADINRALSLLARSAPATPDDASTAKTLDALLAEATQIHRMDRSRDRVLYATQAVRFRRDIHQHPALRERLRRTASQAFNFTRACADLNDAAMLRMAQYLEDLQTN